jgi:hypothetical protein
MSGPSDKAVEAAARRLTGHAGDYEFSEAKARDALAAAYPIIEQEVIAKVVKGEGYRVARETIRADVIREVAAALRGEWAKGRLSNRETQQDAADFIEREFGGGS